MKLFLAYAYLCLAWGTSWMAIKVCNTAFPPLLGAGLRFWLGGVILLVFAILSKRLQSLTRRDVRVLLWTGILTFTIGYGLVYNAEMHIDSALTAAVFGTFPIFTAIFGHLMVKEEKLAPLGFLGVALGFLGVIFLTTPQWNMDDFQTLAWLFLVTLSPVACAFNVAIIRRDGMHLNPCSLNIIPMLLGATALTLMSLAREDWGRVTLSVKGTTALLYLAVFVTVIVFSLYYWMLKKIPLVLLSSTAYVSTGIAVMAGWILLEETRTFIDIIGIILVLVGVYLVQKGKAPGEIKSPNMQPEEIIPREQQGQKT